MDDSVLISDLLSRMESEIRDRGERKKMTTKGKGIRGSSKSGGQFWSLIENVEGRGYIFFLGSTSFWKQ